MHASICVRVLLPAPQTFWKLPVHDMAIQQPWLDCLVPWVQKRVLDSFCPPLTIARLPDSVQLALNTDLRLTATERQTTQPLVLFLSCRQGLHSPRSQPCCYTTSGLLSHAVHQSLSSDRHCSPSLDQTLLSLTTDSLAYDCFTSARQKRLLPSLGYDWS